VFSTSPKEIHEMRKSIVLVAGLLCALASVRPSAATEVTREVLDAMSKHFRYFIILEQTADEPLRFLYADYGPHLHIYSVKDGRAQLEWETTNLGSAVTSLIVRDLDKNGVASIMISTIGGRVVAYDIGTYERVFENFQEPFDKIPCMIVENIDNDPQDEIILLGPRSADDGTYLYIFDSVSGAQEHRSQDPFTATEMLTANVDDDEQLEIILNSGVIIDSRFYRVEPAKLGEGTFGVRMRLMDINGDDIPEIFGELPGFQIRVYDIYAQRELY